MDILLVAFMSFLFLLASGALVMSIMAYTKNTKNSSTNDNPTPLVSAIGSHRRRHGSKQVC